MAAGWKCWGQFTDIELVAGREFSISTQKEMNENLIDLNSIQSSIFFFFFLIFDSVYVYVIIAIFSITINHKFIFLERRKKDNMNDNIDRNNFNMILIVETFFNLLDSKQQLFPHSISSSYIIVTDIYAYCQYSNEGHLAQFKVPENDQFSRRRIKKKQYESPKKCKCSIWNSDLTNHYELWIRILWGAASQWNSNTSGKWIIKCSLSLSRFMYLFFSYCLFGQIKC